LPRSQGLKRIARPAAVAAEDYVMACAGLA
jgi:hypothetical protein